MIAHSGSVAARIARHAMSIPHQLAIQCGNIQLTYGGLDRQSSILATRLREGGVQRDRCVALLFERSTEFIIAALAVWKNGAAYLPIDPSSPSDRVATILSDVGVTALLTMPEGARSFENGPWRVVEFAVVDEELPHFHRRISNARQSLWPT